MEVKELVLRLMEHSGLPTHLPQIPGESLAEKIQAMKRGVAEVELQASFSDILNCLQSLNGYLSAGLGASALERDLVYAVSGIQAMLVDYILVVDMSEASNESQRRSVLALLWAITFAWDATLAGDIDDVRQHLELERHARGLVVPGVTPFG